MSGAIKRQTTNFGFNIINYDFPRWHTFEWQNWDVVDAVLAAAGLTSVRGVWANSTQYIIGDRVIDDTDNTIWLCGVNHTSAASGTFLEDRTANPTYWSVISTLPVNRGMWLTAVNYSTQDIVRFGNAYYFCISAHLSGVFADDLAADKWALIFDLQDAIDAEASAIASAAAAATSETNAATSETNASNSAAAADADRIAAETARIGAEAAETNAETAQTAAENARDEAINVVSAGVNKAIRVDGVQSFTAGEKLQGRTNAGITRVVTQLTPIALTSGTSKEFNDLPAGIRCIRGALVGASTNGASNLALKVGPSAGVVSAGYLGTNSSIANVTPTSGNTPGSILLTQSLASTGVIAGTFKLILVDPTNHTWAYSAMMGNSNLTVSYITAGSIDLAGSLGVVQLLTTAGDTFDGGLFYLEYEAP